MNLFFTEQKNIRLGAIIIQIKYFETSQFTKDLKKLLKRFKTLKDDLENLKRNQIELLHVYKIDNHDTFEIKGFSNPEFVIYKVKKFLLIGYCYKIPAILKIAGKKHSIFVIQQFFSLTFQKLQMQ